MDTWPDGAGLCGISEEDVVVVVVVVSRLLPVRRSVPGKTSCAMAGEETSLFKVVRDEARVRWMNAELNHQVTVLLQTSTIILSLKVVRCLDELVLACPPECEREQDPPIPQMLFVTSKRISPVMHTKSQ